MKVELGASVVLVVGIDALWHVAPLDQPDSADVWPTLCGLNGDVFRYRGAVRTRRCCAVCRMRAPELLEAREEDAEEAPAAYRGGKPKGKYARVTDVQLAALHRAYVEKQLSVRSLAELVWEKLGYANAHACAQSLDALFRDRGYKLRSHHDALVLRNTKHGRRVRALAAVEGDGEYRRWLKEQRGAYRPTCKGIKTNAPGKGKPCSRPAMAGSDYCLGHDPARRQDVEAVTAKMRARQPRREMIAWADVLEQLAPFLARYERAHANRLHEATGVPQATCWRLLHGRSERITVNLAQRLLAALAQQVAA